MNTFNNNVTNVMDMVATKLVDEAVNQQKDNSGKKYSFEFDELQMYYGMDYKIDDQITIKQPSVGDIIEFGEKRVLSAIAPFVSNPTSYRLQLWDMGVDWNKISDYELFIMLIRSSNKEDTSLIFGDVDFGSLAPYINKDTSEVILMDESKKLIIDEEKYMHIREYLRLLFNQYPKVEKAKGKATKQAIINEERIKLANEKKKNNGKQKSAYLPLISAMVNHPGFKYNKNELKQCGIYEFMDSVKRLQIYESTVALMSGMYSGFCDTSKMDLAKDLNWLRDIHD